MGDRRQAPPPITRRDVLKRAVALGALASVASPSIGRGAARTSDGADRVAIIGSGTGGVAAAYFLADAFDVEVFEARAKIGGHCDWHGVEYQREAIAVDLGAQFFHPDTHPIYVTLLEELGLFDPEHPGTG